MPNMRSYLAGNHASCIPLLTASLASVGFTHPVIVDKINVTELGRALPALLVADIDDLDTDPIELLRMARFVLPTCIIAVYTSTLQESWALSCHVAGANCILSKSSEEAQLVIGLREALASGCFTDPSFVAA
jgi:DNA-binding NarL/FixJ family response regulator